MVAQVELADRESNSPRSVATTDELRDPRLHLPGEEPRRLVGQESHQDVAGRRRDRSLDGAARRFRDARRVRLEPPVDRVDRVVDGGVQNRQRP